MTHTTSNPKIHEGRNLKRFREMLGIKQDAFAFELGEDWNQQKVSLLEQKEKIDANILDQVAAVLKIPAAAIQQFEEEKAINIITNTFNNHDQSNGMNIYPTINQHPVDRIIQFHEEKIALYERMLREKDEMMLMLKELIERK
ncbi:helix-turn-helix domain-containing protein [Dyadobacter sandarakinus]|uniref:Helix-turn-helix transcriptional regulator n=1 Tax=Dyadobacter sandarakinus TaxID=2747268 RepID=A0ABX7ICQ7_9BACT|nr:helix-turn-helix transcriptional regulator [Dyadobacter sandarakinus]QRR03770.1 helix-turn-helix transcriptional regulator [Dyadobacter sandarakinus]